MDPYKLLQITLNPDGNSLTRHAPVPSSPPSSSPPTLSKDIPLNAANSTYVRLYLPFHRPQQSKLPLVLYFHGGGFILFSPSSSMFHSACSLRSSRIPAIVLSVGYRLAPEHRLPAAYDDAVESLLWLQSQARDPASADPWLRDHADFSKLFIMGSSAGANIAYHLALRALDLDLAPLGLDGIILNEPYFGGEERTESEEKSTEDKILPLAVNDLMWELALPVGRDRDHEYCNPKGTVGKMGRLPRCLVKGFVGDPLYDREREFVRMLEREGARVVALMEEEGYHGIEMLDESKAEGLIQDCSTFIYGGGDGDGDGDGNVH